MKPAVLLILLLALCLLLAGCQSANFSDVQEVKATENPLADLVSLPTLAPNASQEEKNAFYRNAIELQDRAVSFSAEDGFFSKDVSLTLTAEGACDIYYTDDGSIPGPSSIHYTHPISLTVTDAELPRCAVIRAVAYYQDGAKTPVSTHTYFLNNKISKRFNVPVFSIIAPPDELTSGPNALLVGQRALNTGEYAKRTVLTQLFLRDGSVVMNQNATLRVYGDSSRTAAVKSIQLLSETEEETETQVFAYSFFGTYNPQGAAMDHYSQLVLSNGEDDFQYAFIRDEYAQTLAKQAMFSDYEDVRPVVVYINGEYYGFHWLHECFSDAFLHSLYGTSDGRYAVINWTAESGATSLDQADSEAAAQFQAMYEQILAADLKAEENLETLNQFMDVENHLDYCALNIIIDNINWPAQMQAYAYIPANGDIKNAQWRFLPHAMSNSFGLNGGKNAAENDTLGDALNAEASRYNPLFAKLMEIEAYRTYFIEKVQSLLSDKLSSDAMLSALKELHDARSSEMNHYLTRIEALRKTRNSGVTMKKNDFNTAYSSLTNYVKARPDAVLRQLEQHFFAEDQKMKEEE